MEIIPFPIFDLQSSDIDRFMTAYTALKTAFSPTFEKDFTFPVADYLLFEQYHQADIREAINLHTAGEAFMMFWLMGYNSGSARSGKHQEYQAWGAVTLKNDFGHVLIKEKSLGDFVMNMLHHTELTFPEDKAFSHHFCVMAGDRDKAGVAMDNDFRAALMDIDIPDFTLEIIKNRLLIGNHKLITPEQTLKMAKLLEQLGGL